MKLSFRDVVKTSLYFSVNPLRWVPAFSVNTFFSIALLWWSLAVAENSASMTAMASFSIAAQMVLLIIAWAMVDLWVDGAIVWQSFREKEFIMSWRVALKKYPRIFTITLIASIISVVASYVPVLSIALSIGVSVILFFVIQHALLGDKPVLAAFQSSWSGFIRDVKRNKINNRKLITVAAFSAAFSFMASLPFVLVNPAVYLLMAVLIFFMAFPLLCLFTFSRFAGAYLVSSVVSLLIVVVFALPLLMVVLNVLLLGVSPGQSQDAISMDTLSLIRISLPPLMASGMILILGVSISKAFMLKAQTGFYLRMEKNRRK